MNSPPVQPVADDASRRLQRWAGIALVLVTLAVFAGVAQNDFVNFDDPWFITQNSYVRQGLSAASVRWALTTWTHDFYKPVTWLSHLVDWQLFGEWAGGHHLTNVALHALNAWLFWRLLVATTGAIGPSAVAALLFAVHPLRVESVAWAAERKDVICLTMGLLAIRAYVRYTRQRSPTRYALVAIFMALSLMSKPMLVTLPAALLLLDVWPLGRWRAVPVGAAAGESMGRLIVEKLPLLVLSLIAAGATFVSPEQSGTAMVPFELLPWGPRLGNALVSYGRYLGATLWPIGLAVIYPFELWSAAQVIAAAALLLAITAGVLWRLRRQPYLAVGWFWYLGTLVPVIGVVQVGGQSMADRYTYVPGLGLVIMLTWGVSDALAGKAWGRRALAGATIATGLLLSVLTMRQVTVWRDSITLFRSAIAATERNATAQVMLADALVDRGVESMALGRATEARADLSEAIELFQTVAARYDRDAYAHHRRGLALMYLGRAPEAIEALRRSLALNPLRADVRALAAGLLMHENRPAEAAPLLEEAARQSPDEPAAQYNLGVALAAAGQPQQAEAQFRRTLALNAALAPAHNALGEVLARQGKRAEAAECFRRALAIDPSVKRARENLERIGGTP